MLSRPQAPTCGTHLLIPDSHTLSQQLEWKGERTDYICEMKFSEHNFAIDKSYETELANKIDAFLNCKQHTKTHSIQLVMVTTNGVFPNEHSKDVNQEVVLDDLFT